MSYIDPRDTRSYHRQYSPPVPIPQRPSPAHLNYVQRLSEAQQTDTTWVQSSVSSVTSGSTGLSAMNHRPSHQTYWQAPVAEQGLMNEKKRASWEYSLQNNDAHSPSRQEMVESDSAVLKYIQAQQSLERNDEQKEDDHAIWILFWLSCLDPIHSFISAIYTLLVVFTLTLAFPIRTCKTQASFGDQLIRALAPIFRHHLDMLSAPSVEDAYTFEFKPVLLILVQLASPSLSIGVALSAWVAAAFWLFAIVMGNPDGTEKGDDGRNTVLSVRDWWEGYFLKAVQQRQH